MNARRVLIMSITLLAAGAAGYGLLGLKAPKQPSPAPASPGVSATQTIIAVGPDGNLYAIPAPAGSAGTRAYRGSWRSGHEREAGEGYSYDYPYE